MEDNIPVSANAGSEAARLLIDLVPDLTGGLLCDNFNVPVRGYAAAAHTLKMVELIVEGETIGRAVYGKEAVQNLGVLTPRADMDGGPTVPRQRFLMVDVQQLDLRCGDLLDVFRVSRAEATKRVKKAS